MDFEYLFPLANIVNEELVKLGDFENHRYNIQGEVFLKDKKHLVIKEFTYNGAAPAAVFLVGTSDAPSPNGTTSFDGTILPYPFEGMFYENDDPNAPILDTPYIGEEIM